MSASHFPETAQAAVLTEPRRIEMREYPIPDLGAGEILVEVEGCGIYGTIVP